MEEMHINEIDGHFTLNCINIHQMIEICKSTMIDLMMIAHPSLTLA